MNFINDYFEAERVNPPSMDYLWAQGWRHFGVYFFRYNRAISQQTPHRVMPLRVALAKFSLSKSQKRIVKRNSDLTLHIRPALIDEQKEELFQRHKVRFKEHIPPSLHTFLSPQPAHIPCETQELCLFKDKQLLAVTFLDIGESATSGVYSIFEPAEAKRSLGIYLILCSIDHSLKLNKRYYYPGYAYQASSHYDYKKNFSGLEFYDWQGQWLPLNQGGG